MKLGMKRLTEKLLQCHHTPSSEPQYCSRENVYEACGVKEYWIVDIVNKSFEVYILQNPVFDLDNITRFYLIAQFQS